MRVKLSFVIDCTPERLWQCFEDPEILATWVPGFQKIVITSPEPHGEGGTYEMTVREGKKRVTYHGQNHIWQPGSRIKETITGGRFGPGHALHADHRFTPVGEQTRLDYEHDFEWPGFVGWLTAPLLWLGGRAYTKRMFGKLKEVAEGLSAQAASR